MVVENYAKFINQNHGKAVVITPKNPNSHDGQFPYEIYRYKSFPYQVNEGYRIGWPFKEVFSKDVIHRKFDLLHSHCPLASTFFMNRVTHKYGHKIPHVMTYHTKYEYDIEKRIPTQWGKNFCKNFMLKNIMGADEVWTISEGAADSLRKIGYTGPYRIMLNGVDFARGKTSELKISAFNRRYGLRPDTLVFLYAGRMMWYKNIKISIDCLSLLRKQGLKFKLFMVGIGQDQGAIKRYIKKSGLSHDTIFTGRIDDREFLRAFYSRANLFLFPSTFDTNGLVVREAAACECPSVLARGSCAAEGIEDGFSGFLCEENPQDMARVVKKAISQPELLRKVGKNASKHIYLSWEDAVAKAYQRYEEICENWPYPLPCKEK